MTVEFHSKDSEQPLLELAAQIKQWGAELGFSGVGISDVDVGAASERMRAWLDQGRHGDMGYLVRHMGLRSDPSQLLPADARPALRAICVRMDYRPRTDDGDWLARERARLDDGAVAVVSIYARGRDYHKVLRERLQRLVERIEAALEKSEDEDSRAEDPRRSSIESDETRVLAKSAGARTAVANAATAEQDAAASEIVDAVTRPQSAAAPRFAFRVTTDSAPVLEVELARKSGIGWRGKHTLLLSPEAGSMFFLGEIITNLPLPLDVPAADRCGTCARCIEVCPTQAITAPYTLDARRCISYLTIEHAGSIPVELRPLIGTRAYGCDDCQLACPWNKFAQVASVPDFDVRHGLDGATLIELFAWSESQFNERHAGSAIRRIGYQRWLRNLAVALGNARTSPDVIAALLARVDDASELVREHVAWALAQHRRTGDARGVPINEVEGRS
jgi:epoxyqueuosine reductase